VFPVPARKYGNAAWHSMHVTLNAASQIAHRLSHVPQDPPSFIYPSSQRRMQSDARKLQFSEVQTAALVTDAVALVARLLSVVPVLSFNGQ
jgi:hypothetical protein